MKVTGRFTGASGVPSLTAASGTTPPLPVGRVARASKLLGVLSALFAAGADAGVGVGVAAGAGLAVGPLAGVPCGVGVLVGRADARGSAEGGVLTDMSAISAHPGERRLGGDRVTGYRS